MSHDGSLNHDGADSRVFNAPPDPPEANGSPDDGFGTASWCENVTYAMSVPEHEVAQRIYNQWHRSGAHDRCMMNAAKNVGAVGIYYDGQTWWATFIAQEDSTPPGSAPAPSAPASPAATQAPAPPASKQEPVASEPATQPVASAPADPVVAEAEQQAAEADGQPTVIDDTEDINAPIASLDPVPIAIAGESDVMQGIGDTADAPLTDPVSGYGWQEVVAIAILLALATLFLRRASPKKEPPPEYLEWAAEPERELVGVR
jgi:hypothetical protein